MEHTGQHAANLLGTEENGTVVFDVQHLIMLCRRLVNVGRVSVGDPAKEYAMSDQKKGNRKISWGPNKNCILQCDVNVIEAY